MTDSRPVAVGYARQADGRAAVAACASALGSAAPAMLVVFCGGKHNPEEILEVLRATYGPIPIVGGSAAGAISHAGFGYSGIELGLLAIADPALCPRLCVTHRLLEGEHAAGGQLGRDVAAVAHENAVVLLLYDSVRTGAPLQLHPASSLLAGFQAALKGRAISVIGAGLLTDINLSDAWVFDGAELCRHSAVALIFPPGVAAETIVLHGCSPVSAFVEITRIEGAEVLELDRRPALEVLEQMLGLPPGSAESRNLSLIATLGQKQGDLFAPYDENAYVNRLIVSADRQRGSITLFEPDFEPGARVQIMGRNNALMIDSVRSGVARANGILQAERGLLSLYLDCAGRASAKTGAPIEEAALVVEGLDSSVPLFGFYSGVEIVPFGGYSRSLDWTGVLALLKDNR